VTCLIATAQENDRREGTRLTWRVVGVTEGLGGQFGSLSESVEVSECNLRASAIDGFLDGTVTLIGNLQAK